jgi:hypothetical protein
MRLRLSEANHLTLGDTCAGQSRSQLAQIMVIEKPEDVPGVHNFDQFTSRTSPKEWLTAPAQPPINQFTLRIEANPARRFVFP